MFFVLSSQLREDPLGIVIAPLGHQMPGCFGQFASQGLGRYHPAGFGGLAVKPLAARLVEAPREVGRFDKGPG